MLIVVVEGTIFQPTVTDEFCCCRTSPFPRTHQHHQFPISVSQACTPRGEPFQGARAKFSFYTHVACSLAAKKMSKHSIVASTPQSPAQCPPSDQSLVATIHLQFAVPTVFWRPSRLCPTVANAKLFVSNDEWEVWQCEQPVSNTHHSKYMQIRDQLCILAMPTKCAARSFQVCKTSCHSSVQSDRQNLRKVKIQSLYMFLVNGTMPTCKARNRQHQNSEDAGKWEQSGLPKSICWHDTLCRLLEMELHVQNFLFRSRMQLTCNPTIFCATLPGRTLSVTPWSIVIVEGGWLWLVKNNSFISIQQKTHLRQLGHQAVQRFLTSWLSVRKQDVVCKS